MPYAASPHVRSNALVRSVFSRFPDQITILHRRNRFGCSHRPSVQLILGSVGFSARGGRSRRRHGGSSKLPYLILIGILIVLLGIAAFLWVRRSPAAHVSSVPASTETDLQFFVSVLQQAAGRLAGQVGQAVDRDSGEAVDGVEFTV